MFNPEFLSESRAWEDLIRPDRQIVGFTEKSLEAANLVLSLLPKAPFMSPWGIGTYHQTRITATEAEIIKYAGNLHFVRKVNWANALAKLSEKLGIDLRLDLFNKLLTLPVSHYNHFDKNNEID